MSSSPGLPDAGAAGPRLAAGHPGSTAGPHRASPHPVLTTTDLWGHSATIPSLYLLHFCPLHPQTGSCPGPESPSGPHFLRQLSGPSSSPEPSRCQAGLSVSGCAGPGWREDHRMAKRGQRASGPAGCSRRERPWAGCSTPSVSTNPQAGNCALAQLPVATAAIQDGWEATAAGHTGARHGVVGRCPRAGFLQRTPVPSAAALTGSGMALALSLQASGGGLWPS